MNDMPKEIWVDWAFEEPLVFKEQPKDLYDQGQLTAKYIRANLVTQWQPIETAPRDGTEIVAVFREYSFKKRNGEMLAIPECRTVVYYNGSDWVGDGVYYDTEPSHWMPLPKTPEVSDE